MATCPCGSSREYESCCYPFHSGEKAPATAESLMRSRYSAFAQNLPDYILETHDPETRNEIQREGIADWAKRSEWLGLEILHTQDGESGDEHGFVEFKANYRMQGTPYTHHEKSQFVFKDGHWYYTDGNIQQETVVRGSPKVGRNEPCPCGSGKKYKKCCMK